MKKKSGSIDILYSREFTSFVRNLHTNLRKNARAARRQLAILGKYFLKYEEPYSEISQNHKHLLIRVKLPMTKKSDIALRIAQNRVEIEGVASSKDGHRGFYRAVDLPPNTRIEKARAVFRNETLKVKIPLSKVPIPST